METWGLLEYKAEGVREGGGRMTAATSSHGMASEDSLGRSLPKPPCVAVEVCIALPGDQHGPAKVYTLAVNRLGALALGPRWGAKVTWESGEE